MRRIGKCIGRGKFIVIFEICYFRLSVVSIKEREIIKIKGGWVFIDNCIKENEKV